MRIISLLLTTALWLSLSVSSQCDDKLPAEQLRFFEAKVRPLLAEHCWKCHGPEKQKGELRLDSRSAMLAGGDSGAAIVPLDAKASLLIQAVNYDGLEMPPAGKLKPEQIEILTQWVKLGAPWPGGDQVAAGKKVEKTGFTEEDRLWWAIQPRREVVPPNVKDSPAIIHNPIDQFIAARLEREGLTPAPEAERRVLIRRVTFDLTGLPPTPEEITAFEQDAAANAYERLVDRLLESTRFGERMARHWLDLVRYADGDGYRADDYRPHAWRYRDYVIQAFNDDKPYDRFVQEQLAGDEIFPDSPAAHIATGYLRHGIYEWNARDVRGQWDAMLNDLTDTTADVFLGLGLQCARCHDHKFDPILQRDYFRLRAFLAAVQPGDVVAATAAEKTAHAEKLAQWEQRTAALRESIRVLEQPYLDRAERGAVGRFPEDIQAMIRTPAAQRGPLETQLAALAWRQVIYDWERVDRNFKDTDKERIFALRRELASLEKDKPEPLPVAFAAADVGPLAPEVTIPKKLQQGVIEPGFLTLLDPAPAKITPLPNSTGRRSALALWLTQTENPLTARVMVNRLWQQHFGRGLAANASDFGTLGEPPSHPELLDWLATKFIQEGWSLKKLHRLMVTSAAYRRTSLHPDPSAVAAAKIQDPENRLLWRWVPRRLDAEQIRDSMLAVSGELKIVTGGAGVMPDQPRRTIFTRFMRNTRDPLADVFDAPLWFNSAAARDTTTTPVQSLLLVNSAAMRERGRAFATRLEKLALRDVTAQVQTAYRLAFGREATATEVSQAVAFIQQQQRQSKTELVTAGQASFRPEKVPYRDGQAALLEPESEQAMFRVRESEKLPLSGAFTVEAFVVPRSVSQGGDMRTIAAKWNGDIQGSGWTLGITGYGSRRKPLTLAMQLVGTKRDGSRGEHPVFSDLGITMNKPYFLAAAVTPATKEQPGNIFFALKDLSNDDEPLLTATIEHPMTGGWENKTPVTLGARSGTRPNSFHGVLDDVRLSNLALPAAQMLYTFERISDSTLGYWRFESKPDVYADASVHAHPLEKPASKTETNLTANEAALADFCHALLNASEFLYVE
jgi:Protein of unknown function (DUF1549)/Protein of unknown function (DUF1553)/Planctomycete cytochrome C